MKKLGILLFSILNILILFGCNLSESNIGDKINTPDNNNIPIVGKWELNECIYGEEDEEDLYLGEKGFFNKDAVVIGQDYVIKPNFKFKKVNTDDYLLYKYKIESEDLNLTSSEIEIISVSNDNQHFYEFIKIDEDHLIVHINERFYSMKKLDDYVNKDEIAKHIDEDKSMFRTFDNKKMEKPQTGILLGVKYPTYDESNDTPQWDYKTIWINSKDRDVVSIYELDSLLLPRKNGFWGINVEREIDGESIIDSIKLDSKLMPENNENSKKEDIKDKEKDINKSENKKLPSILKNILFIGNDYISVENINMDLGAKRTLKVYSLDNLEDERPIKLSDIIGEEGEDIFRDGAENLLSLDSATFNESNMGLSRKKGYWVFKGRVNYKKNNEELYKDFDIKAIPPKEMVNYDELSTPWNRIKMRIPQATDAFTSPNEDIMVVETRSTLSIYSISDGKISERSAINRIDLPSQFSIIMSEWATGSYADIWEEEFIKNGGKSIIEE